MSEQAEQQQDPTEVPEDDPSQQSAERDRVEAERKLSPPELAEGGEAGQQSEEGGEEQPSTLSEEDQKLQQQREEQATRQQQGKKDK